jgi:nucleotide-binding universal stress UspA family protein
LHGDPATQEDPMADSDTTLFAYDGSEFAQEAIREAGRMLRPGPALVLTVWQRIETIEFGPIGMTGSEVKDADAEIAKGARRTADEGAEIAAAAGFEATPITEPRRESVWSTIIEVAEQHDAAVIVLGSHGRTGLSYVLKGSIATAVSQHAERPVMIVPRPG